MLMLDLCSGLGGASQAMRARGWHVVTLDNTPAFAPDVLADLAAWSWYGPRPDLIWASPPCTEFSRESMPWCKTGAVPSLALIHAAQRVIREAGPRYWVIENVRGAVPYLGAPRAICGPFYLWGHFPLPGIVRTGRKKESYSSSWRAERARIPYALSEAFAVAIESQAQLDLVAA
jgi:hypothetical protein